LLENGADVNLLTEDGTALMAAVMGERVEMVRFLLEQGADVNAKTEDGNSALTKAAKTGNAELFLLLKQAGAVEDDAQRRAQTIDRMKSLGTALGAYQIDFDTFPVAEQGVISTVIFQDDPQNGLTKNYYNGPATDAWGTEFTYSSDGETYLLKSFGADKAEGDSSGEFDQDIVFKDGYRISP
jgi:ankyrin repeat protein